MNFLIPDNDNMPEMNVGTKELNTIPMRNVYLSSMTPIAYLKATYSKSVRYRTLILSKEEHEYIITSKHFENIGFTYRGYLTHYAKGALISLKNKAREIAKLKKMVLNAKGEYLRKRIIDFLTLHLDTKVFIPGIVNQVAKTPGQLIDLDMKSIYLGLMSPNQVFDIFSKAFGPMRVAKNVVTSEVLRVKLNQMVSVLDVERVLYLMGMIDHNLKLTPRLEDLIVCYSEHYNLNRELTIAALGWTPNEYQVLNDDSILVVDRHPLIVMLDELLLNGCIKTRRGL